jgi:hypothetical protein
MQLLALPAGQRPQRSSAHSSSAAAVVQQSTVCMQHEVLLAI